MVTALLKFRQDATQGEDGEAFVGDLDDPFVIENSDNTGVGSWELQVLERPYGSATTIGVLASGDTSTPAAQITPDAAGGCWRIQLKVWEKINRGGAVDVDIRNIGIPGSNGMIAPPPQVWPLPLPDPRTGRSNAKPNEANFDGQDKGWAGDGDDGLLIHTIRATTPSAGGGDFSGPVSSVADNIVVFSDAGGKTGKDGGEKVAQLRPSAPAIVALTGASNTLSLSHLRKFLTVSHTATAALVVPLNSNVAIPIGSEIEGASVGAGLIVITPENGTVVIHSETGDFSAARYANFTLRKIATNEWLLKGKFIVSGGGYRRLDNTYNPLVRYDFDGTLNDSSGNGRTLSVQSGAEKYSDIKPGFRCFNADGTTRLWYNTADAALRLTGAMSGVFLYAFFAAPGAYSPLISHTGTSGDETSAHNTLYELDFTSGHDMAWVQENGAGVNTDTASLLFTPSKLVYPTTAGLPCTLGFTRTASGSVQLYVNGRAYGTATATRTASDGGASGRLYLFGSSSGFGNACSCWGHALYGTTLSAAEMADIYNRALGQPYYGETYAP